jgi:DNA-binding transcriptional MerR regulator
MKQLYSMTAFAKLLGKKAFQIHYALENGYLPEPNRVSNRRLFSDQDLTLAKRYFAERSKKTEGKQK